tara:strand:+ start:3272 stop:4546 length:1275 start_codon:yes stop_codon:yes gene_type:complete
MLINLFLLNKLSFNDIELYSNLSLTIISIFVCLMVYYEMNYYITLYTLVSYLCIDTLFIPYKKIDMLIHHYLTITCCIYVLLYIDLNTNTYASTQLLITETSSIFLGLKYFTKTSNKLLSILVDLLFLIFFLKLRIYDFGKNIIFNDYYYESLDYNQDEYRKWWVYRSTFGLYAIQLYWMMIIIKIIGKPFFSKIKFYTSEYFLQYTYFLNLLTTAASYVLIMKPQDKITYGTYSFLDIVSNSLLFISSYYFHNNQYELSYANNDVYVFENTRHKNLLLMDVFNINLRLLTQIYVNLNMHNIFHESYHILIYGAILSVISLSIIDNIYYYHIKYNYTIKNYSRKLLTASLYIAPSYGIIMSLYNINDINNILLILIPLYVLLLIPIINPFYNANQIFVHLIMCFINYQLVVNNYYSIKNNDIVD